MRTFRKLRRLESNIETKPSSRVASSEHQSSNIPSFVDSLRSNFGFKDDRRPDDRAPEYDFTVSQPLPVFDTAQTGKLVPCTGGAAEDEFKDEKEPQEDALAKEEDTPLTSTLKELEEAQQQLRELENQKQSLISVMNELRDDCKQLSNDNTSLRTQILSMRSPQDPVHDDAYYSRRLVQLNEMIKSWVASLFKFKKIDHDIQNAEEKRLVRLLEFANGEGPSTSYMKGSIRDMLHVPRKRIALVRHLLAIYLFQMVFTKFCFGLQPKAELVIRQIMSSSEENGIFHIRSHWLSERDFSKILLIREALGRGALVYVESRQSQAKDSLLDLIESMLSPLLPTKQEIRPKLSRILDIAIDLANSMTRERAIFSCELVSGGRAIEDTEMNVSDEDQKGNVFICTFPMFRRKIMAEGMGRNVCILKADVELESAF
jgi:hypothetical protein